MEENTGTWIFLAYRLEFPREDGGTEEKSPPLSLYRDFSSDHRPKPLPVAPPRHLVAETSGAKKDDLCLTGARF